MVMLGVLGLVPNAAAEPLDRFQRAFLKTPLESAVYRGETDTRSALALHSSLSDRGPSASPRARKTVIFCFALCMNCMVIDF